MISTIAQRSTRMIYSGVQPSANNLSKQHYNKREEMIVRSGQQYDLAAVCLWMAFGIGKPEKAENGALAKG